MPSTEDTLERSCRCTGFEAPSFCVVVLHLPDQVALVAATGTLQTPSRCHCPAMPARALEDSEQLPQELRLLRQSAKAVKRSNSRSDWRATPSLQLRRITTIVYLLCRSAELAAIWASRASRKRLPTLDHEDGKITQRVVLTWADNLRGDAEVNAALHSLEHHLREVADDFLIESLIIEDLLTYWSRGIQTTTEVAIVALLRKWRMRPRSDRKEEWLQRLADDTDYRKTWGRCFRARWNLRWAGDNSCRYMTSTVIQTKAAIFIRWMRWATRPRATAMSPVCINMDETAISCLKTTKGGMVGPATFSGPNTSLGCKKQGGFPRCVLIASIVNDDALQPILPQVFLPRSKPGVFPPMKIRRVFADARPPTQAYHGGSGFQSAESMRQWLKDLRRVLHARRPTHPWILIMDCYSVHVSLETLRYARSLGFIVVLIPGRMTWLLQPLDTHVFAQFKRLLRRSVMNRRLESEDGRITWSQGLVAATQAVQVKLISKSWKRVMRGAGLDAEPGPLRPVLRDLLNGVDLNPRPPTLEEIRIVLGSKGPHAQEVWKLLARSGRDSGSSNAAASGSNMASASNNSGAPQAGLGCDGPRPASSSFVPCSTQGTSGAPVSRRVPIGRRLWTPLPRNLMLLNSYPRRQGPSAGTRSQGTPTMPGVVQTGSQSQGRKRGPALSSVL